MDKRVHTKKSPNLTWRHYIFHFKWPLLSTTCALIFLSLTQMNATFAVLPFMHTDETIEPWASDVIYPTNVSDEQTSNTSIVYYLGRKDQLKARDDAQSSAKRQKCIVPMVRTAATPSSYLILEFTPVFGRPRFCSHSKENIFGKTCPYTNCEYTCDKKRESDAHVLLMHKRDLNGQELVKMKRNSEQIWLLWHDESNENSPEIDQYKFNWTISYRISAEASLAAYGITIARQKSWLAQQLEHWIDEQFEQRANQAIWLVSNCRPKKRLQHFRSLRQHYPIAAFGKCISSNESLSLNAHVQSGAGCGRQSSCEKLYLSTSKFYLAFESQSCTDYITEKFWRALAFGIVPVVSGPARKNYARIAPPHSFIHVDDYASAEHLAAALKAIGSNRTLYGTYQAWRGIYDVYHEGKDLDPYRFCELCYRLNTNRQRIWYEKINDWFLESC